MSTKLAPSPGLDRVLAELERLLDTLDKRLAAKAYVWPLSNSAHPDEMDTSFGPRINRDRWDFHDGIDLPAPIGTLVHSVCRGKVHVAGRGGEHGYSSRHVVVEARDAHDDLIYVVYLHLATIHPAIVEGSTVEREQLLGTVGDDDATHPHLHFEFRRGTPREIGSVHPLRYLPYPGTANFTAPAADRFSRLRGLMAARLLFGASSKREGDLVRVEVDLMRGPTLLETRVVDFNDKSTVNEGDSDENRYKNDIAVEGYQKSDMRKYGQSDLRYGILVRNIPSQCDTLVARVVDLGNNVATSRAIPVPDQPATDEFVDFEDGAFPPRGWQAIRSTSGTGSKVAMAATAARRGTGGMASTDLSKTEAATQRAAIARALPPGRFEWIAEGWFDPKDLDLPPHGSIYLLHFLTGDRLYAAARIHHVASSLRAGIVVGSPDGTLASSDSAAVVERGVWRRWRLHLLRIATREATAVLYLDDRGRMTEQARITWDSAEREPLALRVGIGLSSAGATATVFSDEIRLTESRRRPGSHVHVELTREAPRPEALAPS